jgi:hypothetical protein
MRRGILISWTAVSLLGAVDLLLCRHLKLGFDHWAPLALASAVTGGIALVYHVTGRSPALARAAHWTLLWLLFVNAGTVLTYIAAAGGRPLNDGAFAALDAALGFDWQGWAAFLAPRQALRFVLWLCYLSLFPQILISIFWFALADDDGRNEELLLNNVISLLATAAIFILVPALGHRAPGREIEIQTLLALRSGAPSMFDALHLQGLISFPSYHTVLAVLLTFAHRRSPLLFPFAAVNAVMLFAIPTYGGHYLVDMIAGAAVAGVAIAADTAMRAIPWPARTPHLRRTDNQAWLRRAKVWSPGARRSAKLQR